MTEAGKAALGLLRIRLGSLGGEVLLHGDVDGDAVVRRENDVAMKVGAKTDGREPGGLRWSAKASGTGETLFCTMDDVSF